MIGNSGIFGITKGKGYESINKFGENPDIDTGSVPEAIWSQGGVFPFLSTAIDMDVESSDANDTSAGTGARTIQFIGYDDDNIEVVSTVIMNGTTRVEIPTQLKIVTRALILTSGSGMTNAGKIDFVDRATGVIIYQSIAIGEGQTLSAVQICPKDKKGIVKSHYCAYSKIVGISNAQMRLRLRRTDGSILTKYNITLVAESPKDTKNYGIGGIEVLEGEIIFWECVAVASNDTAVEAGFDIEFEDI